jgi:RNA polymerase sigma-70 factor, ECF subfamily
VARYVEAWQAVDFGTLAGLLKSDVVMTMPPLPLRYTGRDAVAAFLTTIPPGGPCERQRFRLIPTRANRQPAVAAYRLGPDGEAYRAWGILVLSTDGDAIAEITACVDPTLLPAFGLPSQLAPD